MNALARHQVDMSSKDVLHPLLDFHETKQRESAWAIEIKEHIDIRRVERLVASDRSEKEKRANSRTTELGFVLPQQVDDLIAFHLALNRKSGGNYTRR
jgi:hypothetical protein